MSRHKRTFGVLLALACFSAFPVLGADDSRFSVAVGTHDNLLIMGSDGRQIADVAGQVVARNITIGNITFQLSYGRDANGQLTAILTPPYLNSVALHFSAGGKSIDAEKAVVTLTFAPISAACRLIPVTSDRSSRFAPAARAQPRGRPASASADGRAGANSCSRAVERTRRSGAGGRCGQRLDSANF